MWTAEEAKYLKAVLHWQEAAAADEEKRQRQAEEEEARRRQQQRQPAGDEFRILVIGARGTGKTALLTRVSTPFLFSLFTPRSVTLEQNRTKQTAQLKKKV
jgi:type VI protein secretion system component VasK